MQENVQLEDSQRGAKRCDFSLAGNPHFLRNPPAQDHPIVANASRSRHERADQAGAELERLSEP